MIHKEAVLFIYKIKLVIESFPTRRSYIGELHSFSLIHAGCVGKLLERNVSYESFIFLA